MPGPVLSTCMHYTDSPLFNKQTLLTKEIGPLTVPFFYVWEGRCTAVLSHFLKVTQQVTRLGLESRAP